jgi:hypothetical protein
MPYQNPERKRHWEREHREKRNAMRRMQRLNTRSECQSIPKPAPDPVSNQNPQNTWKTMLGWAIGIGVVLFAIGGANPPLSSPRPN